MIKKLILALAVVAVTAGTQVGVANAAVVDAVDAPSYFCHRSNSVTNPWQVKPFSNTYSEIDGQGNNDHTLHTGPVPTTPQEAQALKNNKENWGDIIPPVPGVLPGGMNWTNAGQSIWSHDCDYDEPNFEQPLVTFDVKCGVDDVVVTLTNEGQVDGEAIVNGQVVNVPAGQSVNVSVKQGVNVEVVIKRETVYNQTPECTTGRGADPSTPAAQVSAPKAGVNAGSAPIVPIAGLFASLIVLALGVLRLRKTSL